jgi:hypothetical protein
MKRLASRPVGSHPGEVLGDEMATLLASRDDVPANEALWRLVEGGQTIPAFHRKRSPFDV